jgi:PAS domain S-box-containing protein
MTTPERMLSRTVDNLLEGCQVVGPDFRYLYVNAAAARHGRTTADRLIGRTMMEAFPGIEVTEMFSALRRCMEQRAAGAMENEFAFPDGSRGWFEFRFEPVPEGVAILSMDITERKLSQARIEHLNAVLRGTRNVNQLITRERDPQALLDRASAMLVESRGYTTCAFAVVRDGRVERWSDAGDIGKLDNLRRMLAAGNVPDCLGRVLRDGDGLFRTPDPERACPGCPVNRDYTSSREAVVVRLHSDGTVFGALLVSLPTGTTADEEEIDLLREVAGEVAFALRSIEIDAERKAVDEALERSQTRYRELVENIEDVVYSLDAEGRVEFINPAIERVYGFTPEEVIGRSFLEFMHPDDVPGLVASFGRDLSGVVEPYECRGFDREGRVRYVRTTSRVRLEEGRPAGVDGVMVDLTESRGLREQLEMSQRLEAVGRLAGGVAHDFNNLLSVIISYSEFAAEALREGDPVRADLLEIRKAGDRAATLTRQLLAFSRRQVLEPRVLDLNEVVGGIEGLLRRLLGEDVEIAFHPAEGLDTVLADPGQIEQVLMNLAINARDAMPEGGRLTIETANVELDEDYAARHVSVLPGRYVLLSVTDTGRGMDAEVRERLFEPFFTTKETGKGTGLGLSTCYGIVKQSGGNIWVYSEPGQGTTFKVYLPRVDAPATGVTRRSPVTMARGTETVLLVEDECSVRSLSERILRSAGYEVLAASNGGEALLLFEKHASGIDLLLTDVVMPRVSGRELAERLIGLRPGLKVLYMSGYTDDAIVHHGVLDPGTHFVGKPFSSADLTRKVREVLDGDKSG